MSHPAIPREIHWRAVLSVSGIVCLGAILRSWRISLGLPEFLEEAIPLRLALGMREVATGRVDWNPHHFNYPSLSIYLHFALQQAMYAIGHVFGTYKNYADYILTYYVDPSPMVISARILGMVFDLFAILGVMRIGERLGRGAGWVAGLLVAFAPTLITTSHSIYCDSVMAALAIWSLERMLAWWKEGRRSQLVVSAGLLGLAAGAKYPAAILVAPLAWLVWRREGRTGARSFAQAVCVAMVAFVVTTPFAILSPAEFLRDFGFEGAHAAAGHFGSLEHHSFLFHVGNLASNLGWPGLALFAASLPLLLAERSERDAGIAVWIAVLGFGIPISLARIDAERYVIPVLLLAAPLAGVAAILGARMVPGRFRGAALAFGSLLLVAGPAFFGLRAARAGEDTTQRQARAWCEEHIGSQDLLVEERYSARLPGVRERDLTRQEPAYRMASAVARQRLDRLHAFHLVYLPLLTEGSITTTIPVRGGRTVSLTVMPNASDLNQVFYTPGLIANADYLVTSSAVRSRYTEDPTRYPVQCSFYQLLDRSAERVAEFHPGGEVSGPDIVVYRLGDAFRRASGSGAEIDRFWWSRAIPASYPAALSKAMSASGIVLPDSMRTPLGFAPTWVLSLSDPYSRMIQPFVSRLANEYLALGRNESAHALAAVTLGMSPTDPEARVISGASSARLAENGERQARVVAAMGSSAAPSPSRTTSPRRLR